jgi:hypothetical protein
MFRAQPPMSCGRSGPKRLIAEPPDVDHPAIHQSRDNEDRKITYNSFTAICQRPILSIANYT